MLEGFIILLVICLSVILFLCTMVYNVNKQSFKNIRPLKSFIINSEETSDVKLLFFEEIKSIQLFEQELKTFNKDSYDKQLINYAYYYVKIFKEELRDLLSITSEYRAVHYKSDIKDYRKSCKSKREELLTNIKNSKILITSNTVSNIEDINPDLNNLLHDLKVKSNLLDSVISKSLYLNALTLKDKYSLSVKEETKSKIISQLKDINSFLDRDIAIVSENKDKLIINDLAINDIYLKDLETSWNQE